MYDERSASIIALSLLLLILFSSIFVKAQPRGAVVGVKVGDWIRYGNISVTWDSEIMEPEPEFIRLNDTLWFENEVVDIRTETVIVFNQTTKFKNDTERSSVFYLDIYDGVGNDTFMFVPSGLNASDLVYPGITIPFWINETIARIHAGSIREVNHVYVRETQPTEEEPARFIDLSVNYFWDKETGVLTARTGAGMYLDEFGNRLATWSMSDEIVDTNLWGEPEKDDDEVTGFSYTIVVIVTAILILVVGTWRLRPKKKRIKKRKSRLTGAPNVRLHVETSSAKKLEGIIKAGKALFWGKAFERG